MKVAVPIWQGRVSPVFDVAGQLLVLQIDAAAVVARQQEALVAETLERRTERLLDLAIDTLICGAISRPLESLLVARGVEVISRVCGDVEEVVQAYLSDELNDDRFSMPGCCGRQERARRGRCRCRKRTQE